MNNGQLYRTVLLDEQRTNDSMQPIYFDQRLYFKISAKGVYAA